MLGSVLAGHAVQQPLALHQPRQAAQLCGSLQPARSGSGLGMIWEVNYACPRSAI